MVAPGPHKERKRCAQQSGEDRYWCDRELPPAPRQNEKDGERFRHCDNNKIWVRRKSLGKCCQERDCQQNYKQAFADVHDPGNTKVHGSPLIVWLPVGTTVSTEGVQIRHSSRLTCLNQQRPQRRAPARRAFAIPCDPDCRQHSCTAVCPQRRCRLGSAIIVSPQRSARQVRYFMKQ